MDEVKINTSKTLTLNLPSDPDGNLVSVSLFHEFDNLVSGPTSATRTGAGVYTITFGQEASGIYILNSAGKHRADFTYQISGVEYTQSKYINVYTPYCSYEEFFEEYPELEEDFGPKFDKMERQIRNVVNTFTGQSFDPYYDKTIIMNGKNTVNLHLPFPIFTLKKVIADYGSTEELVIHDWKDVRLNNVEKVLHQPFNFNSSFYLRWKVQLVDSVNMMLTSNKFRENTTFSISGDFGWQYVPDNVNQASILLLADAMNDDSSYRRHGFKSVDLDVVKFEMKDSFYESTGNIDADILLMDYTSYVMDYI
jgi:hypothetical protein